MKLVINKDRSVIPVGTWGTKNENDFEIVDFEFPEELEGYNKRIVYLLGGGDNPWDIIKDNKAYITNEITSKENVKGYVWCTKGNPDRPSDTDYRSQEFDIPFYKNEPATGVVPTPKQIDGFNTMLTAMNAKIDEVDALEQTIGAAEAQRQEAEATRVSNESTRQSNEPTRESNEQTRQEQEAERERRTDEAIGNIEDKTAEYNANAEAKTTAFNNNATQKTNEFNSNYTQKVNDFNTNANSKTSVFNSNAETKTNAFNTNATNKTNTFNSNATEKTTTFNTNASTKTSEFNTNAESKTSAFNDNASQKTTNFDNNASEKTDEFNTNAQNKIDEYDEHIVDYQAQIDELQEEVDELSENMPWSTTEQATEISVDDAAKYSRNRLELFGNTSQFSTTGENKLPYPYVETTVTRKGITFTDNGDGSITINGTAQGNSSFTLFGSAYPEMQENFPGNYILGKNCSNLILCRAMYADKQESGAVFYRSVGQSTGTSTQMNTTQYPKGYVEITVLNGTTVDNVTIYPMITDTQDNDYEPYTGGQSSPSPDYPQDIHVVTGNNSISVGNTNYPINLGLLELCQIGNYQDYLYKENGNWYVQKNTGKTILGKPTTGNLVENYTYKYFRFSGEPRGIYPGTNIICSHFIGAYNTVDMRAQALYNNSVYWGSNSTFVRVDKFNTVEEYINALSANDITIIGRARTPTTTQITDETLISQLDEIYNHLALVKGTNNITVTAEDLAPYMKLSYMQDIKSKLDNLDSRLALLE